MKIYIGEDNMDTTQIIKDYINEDIKNLEISFQVSNSLREVKQGLKSKFETQISELAQELGVQEISEFKLQPKNWNNHYIVFSYESNGLLYGLTRKEADPNKTRFAEIENLLEEKMGETFKVSQWWPMWQYFYTNIENNEQFYKDILSGKAKERAKEFIKLINGNFNTNNY